MPNNKYKLNIHSSLVWTLWMIGLGLVILLGIIIGLTGKTSVNEEISSSNILKQKCFKCHDLKRISYFKKSRGQWEKCVLRMQDKDPAWLSSEEVGKICDFLLKNYGFNRKDLFDQLCISCHRQTHKVELLYQNKTKDGWIRAIDRMRQRYHFLIGIDEAEEIKIYWTDPKNNNNLKSEIEEDDLRAGVFEEKCLRCHTYRFLNKKKIDKVKQDHMLERMQLKSPDYITDDDMEDIKKYYRQMFK